MKVLIVGGGGREHALAWKAAQSPRAEKIFVAPGNAGTGSEPKCENVAIAADDIDGLLHFAISAGIELTIIGPETPLVLGIVDRFREAGLSCFGPSRAAAQLEGSKVFAKEFLARHCIPTAAYGSFTGFSEAENYIRRMGAPIVVKADGLAAGKGVVVAQTTDEAVAAARAMLGDGAFGDAGQRVVVEEFLPGEEASFIVMVDGEHVLALATSQDHKRLRDQDQGPNTGGMGAYSPAPVVTPQIHDRILREVIAPTVRGMAAEGRSYTGFLYAGLMIGADGTPKVLEYNCRFGDPETQPVMMRLRSDLLALVEAAIERRLHHVQAMWDPRVALGVVMAADGYPGLYRKGDVIHGLDAETGPAQKIFHAGTVRLNGQVLTHGGRVLCATALGESVAEAQRLAYALAHSISWNGVQYRTDIGHRAVARGR